MVSTKCCVGIIFGILVAVGLAVGIYFATAGSKTEKKDPLNPPETNFFKNLELIVQTKDSIVAYDLVEKTYHEMATVTESPYGITSFDYHNNRTIYYSSTAAGSPIQSAFPREHASLPEYTASWIKTCIAVDQLTGKIYVADRIEGKIYVVDVLGQHHKELITGLTEPLDIVLDHATRNMFILTKSSIFSATMSGVNGKELIKKSDLQAIAVDFTNNRLYYATGKIVMMYDMNTGTEKQVVEQEVTSLAVQDGKLLFISKNNKKLHQCEDTTAKEVLCILHSIPQGNGPYQSIKAYGHLASIEGMTSPCNEDNGGCIHLCLLSPNTDGYDCACDDGWKLNPDKKTCSKTQ